MKNTKIYTVLQNFNKLEQNRLRKFLQSPYFNSDQRIVELFDLVVKFINKKSNKNLSKEALWQKLTGNQSYDDVRFRKYCSDLLKIVESFLAYDLLENDKIAKSNLTLTAIKRRKIEKLYSAFINNSKKLVSSDTDKSSNHYLNNFLVEKNLYELGQSERKKLDQQNIKTISENLDNFYFSEKLKFYTAQLSNGLKPHNDFDAKNYEKIISDILSNDFFDSAAVKIYYNALLTITEPENVDHYNKLRGLLSINATNFPKNEALDLFHSLTNYCIIKINQGNSNYWEELFSVYQEMEKKSVIISEQGEISPSNFKNIVTNSLFLKKWDWTKAFIDKYGQKIPIKYRENSIKFNLGQWYFRQKDYEAALDQLRDLEYDDVMASLHAKTYTIYCYYEIDEQEFLSSYIESFRVYIGRKKEINKNRKRRYLNFLSLVKKLTRILYRDKKAIEKFESDLEKNKKDGVVGANWLSEKIEELK